MKSVSKSEFQKFIADYPRKLEVDVCGICDPPLVSYNDFSIGEWPECMVAKTWGYDDDPKGYFYEPEENREYYILEDVNAEKLEASKSKNLPQLVDDGLIMGENDGLGLLNKQNPQDTSGVDLLSNAAKS